MTNSTLLRLMALQKHGSIKDVPAFKGQPTLASV